MNEAAKLDPDKVSAILAPNGILSQFLKGFEAREEQQKMLRNIVNAFNEDQIALIEAGTGTGKSIAYLLPAIMWALKTKERTIISTNTINLQEQLIDKDIPMLLQALNVNLKAVLVKGMSNYICLRKLRDTMEELPFLTPQEAEEVKRIDVCQQTTKQGSRSELSFNPLPAVWERVGAESDTCNKNKCPYFQQCYFFKARKEANEAQLLVANHHLLFADLAVRAENQNFNNPAILPNYSRVILDEAHNIEDIATEYFADKVSRIDLGRLLARLSSERDKASSGKLPLLKNKLTEHYSKQKNQVPLNMGTLSNKLNVILPGERRDLLQQIGDVFHAFEEFVHQMTSMTETERVGESKSESKLRLLPEHRQQKVWGEEVKPRVLELLATAKRHIASLQGLEIDLKALKDEKFDEITQGLRFEIGALTERLLNTCAVVESFLSDTVNAERVRWIQIEKWKTMSNVHLIDASLDISKLLIDFLFSKFPTTILCSATLSTNKKFDFVRRRLGLLEGALPDKTITENIYDSPFKYEQQVLLAIPSDMPSPDHPHFIEAASERIWQALQASRGNAFILFTSYGMLSACYQRLIERLQAHRFPVLKQGDDSRKALLNTFKATDRSVLFGTDSFWEGVDVAGEALRCVIIVKLPFKVPKEPLIQARSEVITAQGGNPFLDYFVPNAIVKFKQGFGRLIRNKTDRGCILCLDSRLMTKSYGKLFLNSLPPCQTSFSSGDLLQEKMNDFYRKTYYLVAKK